MYQKKKEKKKLQSLSKEHPKPNMDTSHYIPSVVGQALPTSHFPECMNSWHSNQSCHQVKRTVGLQCSNLHRWHWSWSGGFDRACSDMRWRSLQPGFGYRGPSRLQTLPFLVAACTPSADWLIHGTTCKRHKKDSGTKVEISYSSTSKTDNYCIRGNKLW